MADQAHEHHEKAGASSGGHSHDQRHGDRCHTPAVAEIVKDPVCGMTVDPRTSKHRASHDGRTFHFCSAGCKAKFEADPARYLADSSNATAGTSPEGTVYTCPDALYRRADWQWAQNHGATVTHGWKPESGFLKYRWEGYDEALLLYVLGLGSPTNPLPECSYAAWASTYRWENCYGYDYLYAGPLFTHQLSHVWIDFRGIQDAFMRDKGIDYFENSRRATYVQQRYAMDNPRKFAGYAEHCWGITASEGPGPSSLMLNGIQRVFDDYVSRGVPYGPDDGTLAPWAVVASLPFAPEIVLRAIDFCIHQAKLKMFNAYGFKAAFNTTHPGEPGNPYGYWVSPWHFGLNQGPIVLMIENYRSDLLWRLMRGCPYIIAGLRRAGFSGGWLE